MIHLNMIHTVAFAGLVLYLGYGLRRLFKPMARFNIPAPVVGGLVIALIALLFRTWQIDLFTFDLSLRDPLMIAFFTTIGFGASVRLLSVGGPLVMRFFLIAGVFAVLQNLVGMAVAIPFKLSPLFGVLAGSVTLTGGPATGLAFAPEFERAGVTGAASLAVAAAMFGIITGGLMGGPIGTYLVERFKLHGKKRGKHDLPDEAGSEELAVDYTAGVQEEANGTEDGADRMLKNLVAILIAMWAGSWISQIFTELHFTLPAYIGAMAAAALIRNFDDATGWFKLSQKILDDLGNVALSLFLVIALMTLKLWELAGMVLPLFLILLAQAILIWLACLWLVFRFMGRNYEAAVMSSGFCGFMLGTTANAMANMKALVERYGRAPQAFFVVPIVGAFFIDFTNAMIITVFLNIFR
jgi:glutamate:Na+ symporter, ESS family